MREAGGEEGGGGGGGFTEIENNFSVSFDCRVRATTGRQQVTVIDLAY